MKLNSKNVSLYKATTLIYIILFIISLYFNFSRQWPAGTAGYAFLILLDASYILMLAYVVAILRQLGEQKSVATVFALYVVMEAVKIVLPYLPLKASSISLYTTLGGTLSAILGMYLIIQTFNLQSAYIVRAYRMFGLAVAASIVVFFYLTSSGTKAVSVNTKHYLDIVKLLVPFAVFYILQTVGEGLKTGQIEAKS